MTHRLSTKASRTRRCHLPILGGALLCIVFLFSACDGFMDDGGTRELIIQKLQYAEAPTYLINVDDAAGKGVVNSPAGGKANKKVTDIFNVSFSFPDDYEFLYWTIIDTKTNQELANEEYLALSTLNNPETQCTLLKAPEEGMNLTLVPVLADRPTVSNNIPEYESAGIAKASPIVVEFDQAMNPQSIYYIKEEIDELIKLYNLSESDFLTVNVNQTSFKYGYKKGDDIVFKNIQIQNYNNSANLLQYFNPPQFDAANKILTITPKSNFPGGTTVFVILDKKFNYQIQINGKNKSINMSKAVNWHYLVNNS